MVSSSKSNESKPASTSSETALIRRILYSSLSRNEPTPAILPLDFTIPSNQVIDHEFSFLLSLLLREAILSWFNKLSPNRELLSIITEILSTLIEKVYLDLNSENGRKRIDNLVRIQLPNILLDHFREFKRVRRLLPTVNARTAWNRISQNGEIEIDRKTDSKKDQIQTFESGSFESRTISLLYNNSHPHPALSPTTTFSGQISIPYLSSLIFEVLLNLLPPQDSKPDTEILITRDVLTGVLRGSLNKCSRPWFITQSLNKVLDGLGVERDYVVGEKGVEKEKERRRKREEEEKATRDGEKPASALLTTLFVTFERIFSIIQILYFLLLPHVVRSYLEVFSFNSSESSGSPTAEPYETSSNPSSKSNLRRRLQSSSLASDATPGGRRWSIWGNKSRRISSSSSAKRRPSRHGIVAASQDETSFNWEDGALPEEKSTLETLQSVDSNSDVNLNQEEKEDENEALKRERSPKFLPQVIELLKEVLSFPESSLGNQLGVFLDLATKLFGKKMEKLIIAQALPHLTPELAISLIKITRESLLPGGHFGVAPPDPSPKQQVLEFERLKRRVWGITPSPARTLLLGISTKRQEETIHKALNPLCSPEAEGPMTHLALKLIERVCVVLVPRLEDQGQDQNHS